MSLVNQVPKIVPDDFETMLNSNINVSSVAEPWELGCGTAAALSRLEAVQYVQGVSSPLSLSKVLFILHNLLTRLRRLAVTKTFPTSPHLCS